MSPLEAFVRRLVSKKFPYFYNWADGRGTIVPIFWIYLFHLFWKATVESVCEKKASECSELTQVATVGGFVSVLLEQH